MEFYITLGSIAFVIFLIFAIIFIYTKRQQIKCRNNITKLFTKACENKGISEYKFEHVKKDIYDFYFENDSHIYYIKIINNPGNHEICINNAIKWQLRILGDTNGKINFIENVEGLMRLDLNNKEKKEHKLYIVYPNTRALLKVINECEMVFVNPDNDVYGSTVITYKKLEEDLTLLDL